MSFPAYEEYKDSGVEWLGEVPEHWELLPIKRFFGLVAEPAPENNDFELLSIYTDIGVRPRRTLEAKGNKATTTDGYWLVKQGDLIVNKLLAWMGAIGMSAYEGVTSPAYDILRQTRPLNPKFYHYLFRCGICFSEFRRYSRGIMDMRLRLYFDQLGLLPMPFPPPEEQTAIASFLDTETSKIDGLVSEQRRLIELLKEKRQAVISHAVTKGLNPDVKMKASGIQWLGEVPEYWESRKIAHSFPTIGSGTTPKSNVLRFYEGGTIPWVNTGDLNDGLLFGCKRQITVAAMEEHSSLRLYPAGSLLFAMYGATIGKVSILQFEATVNQACCVLSGESPIETEFLYYWFLGVRHGILSLATGGGQPNVSQDVLRTLRVACPEKDEQREIVEFLRERIDRFNSLIADAERAIELLQERRTALISAAVTGKIDVRGYKPEESE